MAHIIDQFWEMIDIIGRDDIRSKDPLLFRHSLDDHLRMRYSYDDIFDIFSSELFLKSIYDLIDTITLLDKNGVFMFVIISYDNSFDICITYIYRRSNILHV